MIEPESWQPWQDDLADAVALTQAIRADDTEGVAAILRNCNSYATCITLAKLLAVAAEEGQASPDHLRSWAASAVRRP